MTSQVCISILHPPGADPLGYESSSERWSPVQSIEKILLSGVESLWTVFEQQFNFQFVTLDLSVMSMLAEPNTESPANVDAAKMWREDRCFDHVQIFNYIKHQMRNDPLIINFCSPLKISIAHIIWLLAGLSSRNVLVQASEKAWTWRNTWDSLYLAVQQQNLHLNIPREPWTKLDLATWCDGSFQFSTWRECIFETLPHFRACKHVSACEETG